MFEATTGYHIAANKKQDIQIAPSCSWFVWFALRWMNASTPLLPGSAWAMEAGALQQHLQTSGQGHSWSLTSDAWAWRAPDGRMGNGAKLWYIDSEITYAPHQELAKFSFQGMYRMGSVCLSNWGSDWTKAVQSSSSFLTVQTNGTGTRTTLWYRTQI